MFWKVNPWEVYNENFKVAKGCLPTLNYLQLLYTHVYPWPECPSWVLSEEALVTGF